MLKAIVIDDEPAAISVIQHHALKSEIVNLVASFTNAEQAITYLNNHTIDIVLLDIHMREVSGIEIAEKLKGKYNIIFTTAFSAYAVKSYDLEITDYLLKPITLERFIKACRKVQRLVLQDSSCLPITIQSGNMKINIRPSTIIFIESKGNYVKIQCTDETTIARLTIKQLRNLLTKDFIQIHKRYLINSQYLVKKSTSIVHLRGNHILPIGSVYKKTFTI